MQLTAAEALESPTLSPSQLAAWRAFLKAHTVITRALEREMVATHQLPLAEYDVLVQLQEAAGGALRMAQLADRVLLSRSGLTRLVERLEQAGLVRRQACPSDARGYFAVITDLGRERLIKAAPDHLRSVSSHFAQPLAEGQIEALRIALEQLVSAVPAECASALADTEVEEPVAVGEASARE
ncbi:MAG TPA: MarR family transcriptional regulator [Candidatus Micrarchaeaceae archaeon]|nr:MarR family transcriptional regulator [Candidatus Micrarchaeaceae archaeon]